MSDAVGTGATRDCGVIPQVWPAPAKLNLFLHITGRRPDGYHALQTVFQFLDFGDQLTFTRRDDGVIERRGGLADVPPDEDLSVRAARLLKEYAGVPVGATITIEKRVPAGAGLGGGSSDAATTLLALNHLWGLHRSREELARLGVRLGADVPVFVRGHAAWAEGIGDALTPVDPPEPWYVVIVPPVHVPTAAIYGDPDLTRHSVPITIRDFLAGRTRNDMESVVRRRFPAVDQALRFLAEFGSPRMTGSGSCVFLAVATADEGESILRQAPDGFSGFVVRGMNRHPLYSICGDGTNWGVAKW